jgi:hypothetical protein
VRCDNKSLESVVVAIGEKEWPCQRDDDNGRQWRLPVDSTPFERLSEPLNFDVRAVDVDGLSPAELISGHIGVAPDRPPRALIGAVAGKVLPAARPVLSYGAADDYGLSALVLRLQVTHSGGEVRSSELPVWKISEGEAPQTALRGRYNLDLGPLGLSVGDKVRVTLEARDFRGSQSGTTAESEPVTLQVTDEKGVLAELNESDEKSFRILDELIQRQLGMGETR